MESRARVRTQVAVAVLLALLSVASPGQAQDCGELARAVPELTERATQEEVRSLADPIAARPAAAQPPIYWEALTRIALDPRGPAEGDEVALHATRWVEAARARRDRAAELDASLALAAAQLELGKLDVAARQIDALLPDLSERADASRRAVALGIRARARWRVGDLDGARVSLARALQEARESVGHDPTARWDCPALPAGRLWATTLRRWRLDLLHVDLAMGRPVPDAVRAATRVWITGDEPSLSLAAAGVLIASLERRPREPRVREAVARAAADAERRWLSRTTSRATAAEVAEVRDAVSELEIALGVAHAERGDVRAALSLFRSGLRRTEARLRELGDTPRRIGHLIQRLRARQEARVHASLRDAREDPAVLSLVLELSCQRRGVYARGADPRACREGAAPLEVRLRDQMRAHRIDRLVQPVAYSVGGEAHAAVLTLRRTGPPEWRELGPLSAVEAARARLVAASAAPGRADGGAAVRLTRLVFGDDRRDARDARVAVVADGFLRHIPYLSLADDGVSWLERRTVVELAGARDLLPDDRDGALGPVVVFGAPDLDDARVPAPSAREARIGGRWAPLPGARSEALRVAAAYRGSDLHLARSATELAFRAILRGTAAPPRILHLATHGGARGAIVDGGWGQLGYLMFTPTRGAGEDTDGFITPDDITAESSRAFAGTDLVVLSACESGAAVPEARSGVDGLRRAFLAAGARSVMSTLWTVDDEATQALVAAFHGALRRGVDRHDALRLAALRVRRRWAHPYYWAGFQMLGRPGPVTADVAAPATPPPALAR